MSDSNQKNRKFLKPITAVIALIATSSPLIADSVPTGITASAVQVAETSSNLSSVIDTPLLIKRADASFQKIGHYSHSSHSSHRSHSSHSSHYSSSY